MVSGSQVLAEAAVVGIIFMIIFMVLHMVAMSMDASGSMGHKGMAVTAFLAAALFHVGAEYTGWNKKFCDEYR